MQIICRKRLHFQDNEILDDPKTNEKKAVLKRQLVVAPSVHPQDVPDWIKVDDLFRLSVEDGTITEVKVLSTPKKNAKLAKPSTEEPEGKKEDAATAGWGAKPGAGLPNGNDLDGGTT
jgi:hypothetical protein